MISPNGNRHRGREPLLIVRDLTVRFGGVTAVNGVDLTVHRGVIHGLIGPNGAGKTTLIDAISGFERPATGHVELEGHVLDRIRAHRRARLGMSRSFQHLELFADLTVGENLRAAARSSPRATYSTAEEAASLLGVDDVLERDVQDLSHGRRRLVSVARALCVKPSLLVLDEPGAGLDSSETTALGHSLRAVLAMGVTVLLVDHDMTLVLPFSDRVTVLNFGEVLADGTPAEIQANKDVRDAYLGD